MTRTPGRKAADSAMFYARALARPRLSNGVGSVARETAEGTIYITYTSPDKHYQVATAAEVIAVGPKREVLPVLERLLTPP